MNKIIVKNLMVLGAVLSLVGCGSSDGGGNQSNGDTPEGSPSEVQAVIDGPSYTLSQELTNTLAYMGNEERLAYDVYNELYRQYGTKQFTNIATKSEYKHIAAVQALIQKYKLNDNVSFTNVDLPALGYMNTPIENMKAGTYDVAIIQKLYDDLVAQGSASEIDALKVGCIIEVADVTDLDADIRLAVSEGASDVVTVFNFLRNGSYSHYWAFDEGLKGKGVTDGCCSLGTAYCKNYPKNENKKK